MDQINQSYFDSLLDLKKDQKRRVLKIGENVFPTAIAPAAMWKDLPLRHYNDLKNSKKKYEELARSSALWLKKTQAGGGTSIIREKYLQAVRKNVKLGAKGTDLFIKQDGENISLAEVQILQAAYKVKNKFVEEIFIQDLISPETRDPLNKLWKKKSLVDLTKEIKGFKHFGEVLQELAPTIDPSGGLSTRRVAPAGHGFFSYEAILNAVYGRNIPHTEAKNLLGVIGNGEDLGSTPDSLILGWVIDEKVPIAMVTTEKTEIDLKGGQISFVKENGDLYLTLIEQAQAKESGQLKFFEEIGIEKCNEGQLALFNTNVALFNYEILVPKLKELVAKIGEEAFKRAITPTLIENKKSQTDEDGATRSYVQLEGAMGSSLLNLDRIWRKNFNGHLVTFINIEKENRTRFFSPVKTAFDFFMLFHSDRFNFDFESWQLHDSRPGKLPIISLSNEYYNEVQNVLDAFSECRIKDLDSLKISGNPVDCSCVRLSGRIQINNGSPTLFRLAKANMVQIQDKNIEVALDGSLKVTNL